MLSDEFRTEGFDAASWHNLVSLVDGSRPITAEPTPRGVLVLLLDGGGTPRRALRGGGGVAPDPADIGPLDDLGAVAARHDAARVVAIDEDTADALVDDMRARISLDAGYATQGLQLLGIVREWERAGRLRTWPRLGRMSPWTEATLGRALDLALPIGTSALACVWEGDRIWTAAALRHAEHGIDRLVGPERILDWAGPLSGDPQRDHRLLTRSVGAALAPVHVGLFASRALLTDLVRRAEPGAWARAVATRDVVIQPMPSFAVALVTADTLRGAAAWAGRRADELDLPSRLGPVTRGWHARMKGLTDAARFEPLIAIWRQWQAPRRQDDGSDR